MYFFRCYQSSEVDNLCAFNAVSFPYEKGINAHCIIINDVCHYTIKTQNIVIYIDILPLKICNIL